MTSWYLVSPWCQENKSLWLWRVFAFWSLQTPRNWLPFHNGWVRTSPCSRKVAFNLQSCAELPGPARPMQIQEMRWPNPLMCLDVCFRQAGSNEGATTSPGKVGDVTEQRAGMGNTLDICLFLLSSSHSTYLGFLFAISWENRQREECW